MVSACHTGPFKQIIIKGTKALQSKDQQASTTPRIMGTKERVYMIWKYHRLLSLRYLSRKSKKNLNYLELFPFQHILFGVLANGSISKAIERIALTWSITLSLKYQPWWWWWWWTPISDKFKVHLQHSESTIIKSYSFYDIHRTDLPTALIINLSINQSIANFPYFLKFQIHVFRTNRVSSVVHDELRQTPKVIKSANKYIFRNDKSHLLN